MPDICLCVIHLVKTGLGRPVLECANIAIIILYYEHVVIVYLLSTGLSWVRIPLRQLRFRTLAIAFTPFCQCLSEETLVKAVGSFYLVSISGEVKDPTSLHWKCVTCRGLHILA